MKDKFTVIECNTPVGDMLITDVSYDYTKRMAKYYEEMTYEGPVTEAVQNLEYTHFLDIGAAYGYYSLVAAARPDVQRVLAYEPHPIRFGLLWWNTRTKDKITPRMEFVGDEVSMAKVAISSNPSGLFGGEVGSRVPLTEEQHEVMPTTTLDNTYRYLRLLSKEPMKILTKIDVEGFEINVLEGAQHLFQPGNLFIIETHKGVVSDEEVVAYMAANGFGEHKTLINNPKNSCILFQSNA